ncbi:MAG: hypothetical protein ACYTX0_60405, partial [Nostoc sp.]
QNAFSKQIFSEVDTNGFPAHLTRLGNLSSTRILSETGAIGNKGYSIDKSNRQGKIGYKQLSFGQTLGYNFDPL